MLLPKHLASPRWPAAAAALWLAAVPAPAQEPATAEDTPPETVVEKEAPPPATSPAPEGPPPSLDTSPATAPPPVTLDDPPTLDVPGGAAESSPALFAPGGARPSLSQNATIHLINRLVQRGVLTQADAAELIQLAEADATAAAQAAAAATPAPPVAPPPLPGDVRVTYIPEVVRAQIRDELKTEVLAQAKQEQWLGEKKSPEWVQRLVPFGDFRLRYQINTYPDGNDNTGAFPNFNAINTGTPFDVSGYEFSPQYNVDQERHRLSLRLRLGAEYDLGEDFTIGARIGTGETNSPVSSNQGLGAAANGQGGNFSKYAIWLDRAYLKYEPNENFKLWLGRFDNPFFSTDLMWSDNIGFDGLAFQVGYRFNEDTRAWLTAGAFPVFNTDFHFASNRPDKFDSTDKWLYGAQFGVEFKLGKDVEAKLAAAYYDFQDIEGRLSDPYTPLSPRDAGNTDGTRPAFAQKGNTYIALRNIIPSALNNYGTSYQYQYFGLATPFRILSFTGRLDYNGFEPFQLSLVGDYALNTAFDRDAINRKAVNNRGPNSAAGAVGDFAGDDTAWSLTFRAGNPALEKRWDWNVWAGYRWVGSDAVVDGFNDQYFGGGGTNMKGWTLGGRLALSSNVYFGAQWLSADEIAGPPLKSDIFMFDLNAKF